MKRQPPHIYLSNQSINHAQITINYIVILITIRSKKILMCKSKSYILIVDLTQLFMICIQLEYSMTLRCLFTSVHKQHVEQKPALI